MAWNVLAATRRHRAPSIGVVVKKSSGGLWLVNAGGKKVLAVPLTDEPIQEGTKVRLTAVGSLVQRPMILGAVK